MVPASDPELVDLGKGSRICISNKFPGYVENPCMMVIAALKCGIYV
jgi:hypothetical protein